MKSWKILHDSKEIEGEPSEILEILYKNRNISKEERESFLNIKTSEISLTEVGIDKKEYEKYYVRIEVAISKEEKIIIFGDYDVDGITASAILWETLYAKSKKVIPYIPDRLDEGYGLSKKGIENVLNIHPDTKLIITVDNGIVAFDAIDFAKSEGIDVIVTDHHVKGKKLPDTIALIHTTSLCGAGIAWVLARELKYENNESVREKRSLAGLATVADLVPLLRFNRALVKEGIEELKKTKRMGLVELLREAGLEKDNISVYALGHIIGPRLNATGRIQSAMNALRLLCTKDPKKAKDLSFMLTNINKERQELTEESVAHAKLAALEYSSESRVIVVSHESYGQGIIGLIASQLVEASYRPSFAISKGEEISKGSARSISGVNIIELLRSVSHTLLEAGRHPMAAGFSLRTDMIEKFIEALTIEAEKVVTKELLDRYLTIDMRLSFLSITKALVSELHKLEPYGMGNFEPVFATDSVTVLETRKLGKEQNHLKLKVEKDGKVFDAIAFRMADKLDILSGDSINMAYTVDENEWNGKVSLQLKVRDIIPQ